MPLRVERRPDTHSLWITGTVRPADATRGVRVRRRAGSDDPRLAAEEAATLEASILRTAWHGPRAGVHSFADAALNYPKHEQEVLVLEVSKEEWRAKWLATADQNDKFVQEYREEAARAKAENRQYYRDPESSSWVPRDKMTERQCLNDAERYGEAAAWCREMAEHADDAQLLTLIAGVIPFVEEDEPPPRDAEGVAAEIVDALRKAGWTLTPPAGMRRSA